MPHAPCKANLITCSLLIIFLNSEIVWSTLRLSDIKIKDYYLGSSKIYSPDHDKKLKKRDLHVSSEKEFLFDMKLSGNGKPFAVYIKRRNSDILTKQTRFIKLYNMSHFENISIPNDSSLYEGYIVDEPENSSVNGYIKEEHFYGHVIIKDSFYYIDELVDKVALDLPNGTIADNNAIVFKKDSVTIGFFLNETKSARDLFTLLMKKNYYQTKFRSWKKNGMLCPLVIVIDNSFLTKVHHSNVEAAIYHVLFSLEEANSIFRSTDFDEDGIPDNIGFYVKKVVVLVTSDPVYFVPKFQPLMKVENFIITFTRYEELSRHCLGILFTAQKLDGGTLGASFTPDSTSLYPTSGICDRHVQGVGHLNALVITAATYQANLVRQILFEVTIAHELGHSFGSTHDFKAKCSGHVMSSASFVDYENNRKHLAFSSCSKLHILRTLVMKGHCMEPVQMSFCGNAIVEDGEDCDCGLTSDCLKKDPCCISRRTKEYPCKINKKRGFECHPSQGKCCTNDCKYSTNLENIVSCKYFDKTCPCTKNQSVCTCGLYGTCLQEQCHSIECTRLHLTECQCSKDQSASQICMICCQYQDTCMSALEATKAVLSSSQGESIFKSIELLKQDQPVYETKQFIAKRFCVANECINLQFFQSSHGGYCLHEGQLGKCGLNAQCKTLKSKHTFPTFENASGRFSKSFVHLICYLLLNSFLIYINAN